MRPADWVLADADRDELIRLEEGMLRTEYRFDRAFQELRFSADFIEFGSSGRVYRRAEVIRSQATEIHARLPLRNLVVRLLDQHTAQVIYDSAETVAGTIRHSRRSSIWSRTDAGWVMRFHQGTPYAPS